MNMANMQDDEHSIYDSPYNLNHGLLLGQKQLFIKNGINNKQGQTLVLTLFCFDYILSK